MAEGFHEVRDLAEPALRELLARGRPEERVWAIWALALRSAGNVGELEQHRDPDPGVRRNLAIVLAGHGKLDLLLALAERDPAPEVRAGALQLVARLAIDGKLAPELVMARVAADVAGVRSAVLGTIFTGAPRWLVELAIRLLDDPDGDVRYEAFEALVRAGELPHALVWLEEAPEQEARLSLMKWTARGNVRTVAERLAGASRRLRRLLVESVRVPRYADLAAALDADPMLLRALFARDPLELQRIPAAPLARATLSAHERTWLDELRARLRSVDHAPADLVPYLPALHELAETVGEPATVLDELARLLVH